MKIDCNEDADCDEDATAMKMPTAMEMPTAAVEGHSDPVSWVLQV
jgi:hypothetical protein